MKSKPRETLLHQSNSQSYSPSKSSRSTRNNVPKVWRAHQANPPSNRSLLLNCLVQKDCLLQFCSCYRWPGRCRFRFPSAHARLPVQNSPESSSFAYGRARVEGGEDRRPSGRARSRGLYCPFKGRSAAARETRRLEGNLGGDCLLRLTSHKQTPPGWRRWQRGSGGMRKAERLATRENSRLRKVLSTPKFLQRTVFALKNRFESCFRTVFTAVPSFWPEVTGEVVFQAPRLNLCVPRFLNFNWVFETFF